MKKSDALTVSIGVLAVADTYITATVFPVPVWVTFIAWASFFVVGGGPRGFVQSVASNLTGLIIASLSLLAIALSNQTPMVAAICVGVGSAAMVQASKLKLLKVLPAVVWGFASTVGTSVATGKAITTAGIQNPALIAAAALITGALFGIVSEFLGDVLSHKPHTAPNSIDLALQESQK
ncbi:DUF1097 domain-containing protein [Pararobbsia alpina]|uniref:DUF1097 domain-containing protein n=1 Tax=Pararobbsia alpina TaxID=621374 RepID=A0A6S7BJU4_9BURK|nr:DUF1097 domain-containing protein [Pararobbsia alpina]CAB3790948.1 hypothetical protein LMG28138_03068 [Pararobbsia alpina]